MIKRKIIQITSSENTNNIMVLYALCNDGTVWRKYGGNEWKRVDTVQIETT